jgi:hypothetical protein
MTALMRRTIDLTVSSSILLNDSPHPLLSDSSSGQRSAVSPSEYRALSGLLPQFDNHLKVFNLVEYAAKIRLHHFFSSFAISSLVDCILTLLN